MNEAGEITISTPEKVFTFCRNHIHSEISEISLFFLLQFNIISLKSFKALSHDIEAVDTEAGDNEAGDTEAVDIEAVDAEAGNTEAGDTEADDVDDYFEAIGQSSRWRILRNRRESIVARFGSETLCRIPENNSLDDESSEGNERPCVPDLVLSRRISDESDKQSSIISLSDSPGQASSYPGTVRPLRSHPMLPFLQNP